MSEKLYNYDKVEFVYVAYAEMLLNYATPLKEIIDEYLFNINDYATDEEEYLRRMYELVNENKAKCYLLMDMAGNLGLVGFIVVVDNYDTSLNNTPTIVSSFLRKALYKKDRYNEFAKACQLTDAKLMLNKNGLDKGRYDSIVKSGGKETGTYVVFDFIGRGEA